MFNPYEIQESLFKKVFYIKCDCFSLKNREKPSVFVLGRSVPPRSGGTPSILANQFAWLDYNFVFMGTIPGLNEWRNGMKPNWYFYGIPPIRSHRFIPGFQWLWVFQIVFNGLQVIKRHKCKAIILLLLDERYIFSGYIISLISGLPLIFYVQDLFADAKTKDDGYFNRKFAIWLEKHVIKQAKFHITNIPSLVGYYRKTRGIEMKLVTNCYPPGVRPKRYNNLLKNKQRGEFTIGFCGNIYWPHGDNMKKLCLAASKIPNSRLTIFGNQSAEYLESVGITGIPISLKYYPNPNDLLEELAKCDVLYLPFTFDPRYSNYSTYCSFPTKVHDYLACGRPIIVHCPPYAYLSKYFIGNGAAKVVNRDSTSALLKALLQLKDDKDFEKKVVETGYEISKSYASSKPVYELKNILTQIV